MKFRGGGITILIGTPPESFADQVVIVYDGNPNRNSPLSSAKREILLTFASSTDFHFNTGSIGSSPWYEEFTFEEILYYLGYDVAPFPKNTKWRIVCENVSQTWKE